MKKILMCICIFCMMGATPALAEPCANGHGVVVVGNDGKNYCRSKIAMNWWSAHAWCEAASMDLIETSKHCSCTGNEKCNEPVSCPNFYATDDGATVWTATPGSDETAFVVNLSSGAITSSHGSGTRTNAYYYALCFQAPAFK